MGASIVVLAVAAIGVVSWKTFLPASGPRTDALDSPAPIKPGAYPIRKLKIPSPAEFLEARRARSKKPQAGAAALAMQGNELPSTEAATGKPSPVENQAGAGRQPEIETPSKDNDNIQVQTGTPGTELPQDENPPGENRLAEIDNPKSSNDTMQTQVAALRKEKETNPSAPPPVRAVDGTSAAVFGGEIAIGTRDTQGVAITLKEAIEAMNTSARKPVGKASR